MYIYIMYEYVCQYIYVHICMVVNIYIYIYIIYIYIYIYIYICTIHILAFFAFRCFIRRFFFANLLATTWFFRTFLQPAAVALLAQQAEGKTPTLPAQAIKPNTGMIPQFF